MGVGLLAAQGMGTGIGTGMGMGMGSAAARQSSTNMGGWEQPKTRVCEWTEEEKAGLGQGRVRGATRAEPAGCGEGDALHGQWGTVGRLWLPAELCIWKSSSRTREGREGRLWPPWWPWGGG